MKKIFFFTFYIVLLSFITAQTPSFQWVKSINSSATMKSYTIKVDDAGNVYTTGEFYGTVDFDPGPGVFNLNSGSNTALFILKLDASGNLVWAKSINGSSTYSYIGFAINVNNSGNVLVTGIFSGTSDFDPGSNVFNLTSMGISDVFILTLDTNGNFIWAKQVGGVNSTNIVSRCLKLDNSDNIYICGYFNGTIDFDPGVTTNTISSYSNLNNVFILKLNSNGNFGWVKQIGGNSGGPLGALGYALSLDKTGNILCTGYFSGTADFDPNAGTFNLTANGLPDAFVLKLSSNGNFILAKSMGGNNMNTAELSLDITNDKHGNIYTSGSFTGICDFDPGVGTFTLNSSSSNGIFISKLDSSGNFIFAKNIGGENNNFGNSIAVDTSNNIYFTGKSSGIVIIKLDSSGNSVWSHYFSGTAQDHGSSITVDKFNNIYSIGYFDALVDFDPGPGVATPTISTSGTNTFFLKLSQNIVGLKENKFETIFNFFPNPTNSIINIESKALNSMNAKIQILNSLGQIVLEENTIADNTPINIQHFSKGIYLLKIISDDKIISTQKIIKE